jgi:small GTP-binding protein
MELLSRNNTNLPVQSNLLKSAKISVIGLPAVGKSTLTKLIRGQQVSNMYKPTMGFQLRNTNLQGVSFKIWDFGGQKSFLKNHLSKYIHGTDIIFVVTDSTPQNVLATKELVEHSKTLVSEDCEIVAIANKQDLKGHMSSDRVENVLQVNTFPMVAIDQTKRLYMVEIVRTLMGYVEKKKLGEEL